MASNEIIEKNKSGDSSLHDWFSKSKSSDGPRMLGFNSVVNTQVNCAKQPTNNNQTKCGSSKMKRNLNKTEED